MWLGTRRSQETKGLAREGDVGHTRQIVKPASQLALRPFNNPPWMARVVQAAWWVKGGDGEQWSRIFRVSQGCMAFTGQTSACGHQLWVCFHTLLNCTF